MQIGKAPLRRRRMVKKPVSKEVLNTRLNRIEGQLRGLRKMIDEDKDCENILIQLTAIRGGIESIGSLVLKNYMTLCMSKKLGSEMDNVEALSKAVSIWMKSKSSP
jgi:DNA-binding FrmR family transcriptional regulator